MEEREKKKGGILCFACAAWLHILNGKYSFHTLKYLYNGTNNKWVNHLERQCVSVEFHFNRFKVLVHPDLGTFGLLFKKVRPLPLTAWTLKMLFLYFIKSIHMYYTSVLSDMLFSGKVRGVSNKCYAVSPWRRCKCCVRPRPPSAALARPAHTNSPPELCPSLGEAYGLEAVCEQGRPLHKPYTLNTSITRCTLSSA